MATKATRASMALTPRAHGACGRGAAERPPSGAIRDARLCPSATRARPLVQAREAFSGRAAASLTGLFKGHPEASTK